MLQLFEVLIAGSKVLVLFVLMSVSNGRLDAMFLAVFLGYLFAFSPLLPMLVACGFDRFLLYGSY
jgi:hypothetical protein